MRDSLGCVEWIEVIVEKWNENAAQFRLLGGRRHFCRLELGYEALESRVELKRQQ